MTNEEYTILQLASLIKEKQSWEFRCKGCKHLGDAKWMFAGQEGCTHKCNHPDRQGGFSDPRPYGCKGHCFERK